MIHTLTLNPSVDYIVELEGLQMGGLNRTKKESKFPGGKGINVSRVLNEFGLNSNALGFIGGFTGKYIEKYLHSEKIKTNFVNVNEDSRINVKLKTGQETEINANGPAITEADYGQLKEIVRQLTKNDLLVMAGSIPSTLPESTYQELAEICRNNQTEFVVDAEGGLLSKVLPYQPFLIKPNHHELGELFSASVKTCEEAVPFGKKLIEMGAKNVIVSLAGDGAVFINKDRVMFANVPTGKVKNSVGAGDSMVAGFLAEYHRTGNLTEAFRFSVASGSATAFSLGLCNKESVNELLNQIHITDRS